MPLTAAFRNFFCLKYYENVNILGNNRKRGVKFYWIFFRAITGVSSCDCSGGSRPITTITTTKIKPKLPAFIMRMSRMLCLKSQFTHDNSTWVHQN